MDINSFKYYVFYDLETTGINPVFDQIIQFAAVKTDLDFNELERYQYRLKLRQDVIPNPGALIVNRLNIKDITNGDKEYEAIQMMRSILSSPNTINIGYNSISFDDEFMRFAYDRNLLDPYSNQSNETNCIRMDVMPITIMYFLYQKDALVWPNNNGKPNLKLENLNDLNGLAKGMAHDAVVDVLATIELARRFKDFNPDMWSYLCQTFDKEIDLDRINKLDKIIISDNLHCEKGIIIRNTFGYKSNCMSQCIKVAVHKKTKQTLWLRLDKQDFNRLSSNEILSGLKKNIVKRKPGIPDYVLPITDKYNRSSNKKRELYEINSKWARDNVEYMEELSQQLATHEYELREIDIDSHLYQRGSFFFNKEKREVCQNFHQINDLDKKNEYIEKIEFEDIKQVAIRLMGRNYYESLSPYLKQEFNNYISSIKQNEHTDHIGNRRNTIEKSIQDIRNKLDEPSKFDNQQIDILESYQSYLLSRDS